MRPAIHLLAAAGFFAVSMAASAQTLVVDEFNRGGTPGTDDGGDDTHTIGALRAPQGQSVVTIADASAVEGDPPGVTTMTFIVTLSNPVKGGCTFNIENFGTPPGTQATPGVDYIFPSPDPVISIPEDQTETSFDVVVVRDTDVEDDEVFAVSAYGEPFGCDISNANAVGTIIDDDVAAPPDISISDLSLLEGNAGITAATLTVSLSASAPAGGVSVDFATADGTASTALADYAAASGTVNFVAGDDSETITVDLTGDIFFESDETLFVNLSNAVGGNLVDAQGQVTVLNDDGLPELEIDNVAVVEGTGAGSTNAVFSVTLSGAPAPGETVAVDYATAVGTATSGTDFTATSGALTFSNDGSLTQTISVPVTRDNIDESDEGFVVDITAPAANVTDGQGAATIVDDDTAVVTIDPSIRTEGDSGITVFGFNVRLSNPADTIRAYAVYTEDVSATAPSDYQSIPMATPVPVVFNPGETVASVTVNVNGDTMVEENEVFAVNLFDPVVGTPNPLATGAGLIVNDDVPSVSIGDVSVIEGSGGGFTTALFTVTLAEPLLPGRQVLVNYSTAPDTAVVGDYAEATGTLTFVAGGALTQVVGVAVIRDNVDEDDEQFFVNITSPSANVTDDQGAGAIVDDDTALPSIANITLTEGNAGFTTATFTVALSNPSAFPLQYQAFTGDGTAQAPDDYLAIPVGAAAVTFAPLQTSQTVSVDVVGERLVEADETFVLNLGNMAPDGTPPIVASGTATITNDDSAVLSINDITQPEGSGNGTTPFVFTISSSNPSATPITVGYQTSDGSATTPVDYIAANGTATIPAGATNVPVTVTVIADNLQEPDETYSVNLSAAQGASVSDPVGIGTILDDDESLAIPTLDGRALAMLVALMLAIGLLGIARRR
jgi:hypothetical protein